MGDSRWLSLDSSPRTWWTEITTAPEGDAVSIGASGGLFFFGGYVESAKAKAYEVLYGARAWLGKRLDARWENDPFGSSIRASREEYLQLFSEAKSQAYPEVDATEKEMGFYLNREWLDDLALHTQIVKKKETKLAYPHGRLLYSILRREIADRGLDHVTVLETGTARGFSALCMAKALSDSGVSGAIVTIDVLPHLKPQIWNCIDDHEGRKTRADLLSPWSSLTRSVLFLQGDTLRLVERVGLPRINFAFLDAQHTRKSVLAEFNAVASRQLSGDIVFFDDVTPDLFPGVVDAVNEIELRGDYAVRRLSISAQRAYAWATRR